jgi:DNA polymerase-3 subunit alpha
MNTICYGLGAIKGTGPLAISEIVKVRQTSGNFTSLFDFCARIDRTKVNKRTVEALIKAGAFDSISSQRSSLLSSVDLAWEFAQSQANNLNQAGLFDAAHGAHSEEPPLNEQDAWSVRDRLTHEKAAIGFHFSGHLFEEYSSEVRKFVKTSLNGLVDMKEPQWIAGIVKNDRFINTARGKLYIFELDDKSAMLEITADENIFNANRHHIQQDQLLVAQVKVQTDRRDSSQLRLTLVQSINLFEARCRFGKYLKFTFQQERMNLQEIAPLQNILTQRDNATSVNPTQEKGLGIRVLFQMKHCEAEIMLGEDVIFVPTQESLDQLATVFLEGNAFIAYE